MGGTPVRFAGLSNLIIRTGFGGTPVISKAFGRSHAALFNFGGCGFLVFGRVNNKFSHMTTGMRVNWTFTPKVSAERRDRLLAYDSFDEVVALVACATAKSFYWEAATAPYLKGCCRASIKLAVDRTAYDAFFNAPVGYRGQYAVSETHGSRANFSILSVLMPKLLGAVPSWASNHPVRVSLLGQQSKIWIDEFEVENQLSDPDWSIQCPVWEFNEPDGQGLRAPVGECLEVKGAWVDAAGCEVVNPHKCQRARNINRTGDSK